MDELQSICAPGTTYHEEMIATTDQVSIRLITFSGPPQRKKPDIVFVAGWVSLIDGWREILTELTREYRIFYIETREKISSHVGKGVDYDVGAIGDDVVSVIEHLDLKKEQYFLVGSSLGATAIIDCYQKIHEQPKCLILVGPNAEFRVPLTWKIIVKSFYPGLYKLLKPSVLWYLRTFRLNIDTDYGQYEKYSRALNSADPWKLRRAVLALAKYQIWEVLATITCPVLIIGASKDKLHEPENLKRIVDLLPHGEYVDMETNKQTHSKAMTIHLNNFLDKFHKNKKDD